MKNLKYPSPAKKWIDALPLGNGITGVMVYGGIKKERITFNDSTLWSGRPKKHDNHKSLDNLEAVRELIFKGENHLADRLTEDKLCGDYSEGYLPLGELNIKFRGARRGFYERSLDIGKAIFNVKSGSSNREAFCSYPARVFVYKVSSLTPFDAIITTSSKIPAHKVSYNEDITLVGQAPDHVVPSYMGPVPNAVQYNDLLGMSFALVSRIKTDGTTTYSQKGYEVTGAKEMVIYATTATGFISYDKVPENDYDYPLEKCLNHLNSLSYDYESLKAEHIADYTSLYNRHSLKIAEDKGQSTSSLYRKARRGNITPELISLFYNYGKYLTIAGSRKGGQPLNLQGIWNDDIRPPWSSNYTTNINAQMNYWPTSQIGLSDCLAPYFQMVYELSLRGTSTAKTNYGASGFCVNHNTDIWRKTAPVKGNPQYMFAPLCGAWLVNEIYEHYTYGGLEEYKDMLGEILKSNTAFILDYLVLHDGKYVTCPSASPENTFLKNGKRCYLDYASAFEMGIVKQSLNNYLSFFNEGEYVNKVKEILPLLYPFQEDIDGIVEWSKYYPAPEVGHRHFSPLYSFHPARQIGYFSHPEEREWVRRLMHTRIYNVKQYFGWSGAWALALSARLREKETTALVISRVLGKAIFKNLFDMHPPRLFQIDGNFGFVHGINEALIQIEGDTIELLPALPSYLASGKLEGARLPNGYLVDMEWKEGKVIYLKCNRPIKIRNINVSENATLINGEII